MQIKNTLMIPPHHCSNSYHHKHQQQQILAKMRGKMNPCTLLVECKLVEPLWKTIWRLLKNLNINLPYDPAIPLLGIYPKECNMVTPKASAYPCLFQHYSQ
jgi:hypothetical protein